MLTHWLTIIPLQWKLKQLHSTKKLVNCSIGSLFLSVVIYGISKWRKICLNIGTLNWLNFFPRTLAQIEGVVWRKVLRPQFLTDLFYEVLSISFFLLQQQFPGITLDFYGTLLSSSARCETRKQKSCTCLLLRHSCLSNSRLFCSSLAFRISLYTCWGSALRPLCSPRWNLTVIFNLVGEPKGFCPWLGRTQPILTAWSDYGDAFTLCRLPGVHVVSYKLYWLIWWTCLLNLHDACHSVADCLSPFTQWFPLSKCDSSSAKVLKLLMQILSIQTYRFPNRTKLCLHLSSLGWCIYIYICVYLYKWESLLTCGVPFTGLSKSALLMSAAVRMSYPSLQYGRMHVFMGHNIRSHTSLPHCGSE